VAWRRGEHAARGVAEQTRRHVDDKLVDEPGRKQRAVEARTSLDPYVVDLEGREPCQHGAQIAVLRRAGDDLDPRPGPAQSYGSGVSGRARREDYDVTRQR